MIDVELKREISKSFLDNCRKTPWCNNCVCGYTRFKYECYIAYTLSYLKIENNKDVVNEIMDHFKKYCKLKDYNGCSRCKHSCDETSCIISYTLDYANKGE